MKDQITNNNRFDVVSKIGLILLFGLAFGYVEAAVVFYLRKIINFHSNYDISHYHTILNLYFITFVDPIKSLLVNSQLNKVEVIREACTIIMLLCLALLVGKNKLQKLAVFMMGFATWDLAYYLFLKILDNWPQSVFTKDVFFLIPVTWIGPVLTPLIISTIILLGGTYLFIKNN
jgi:hypothetical protein